MTQMEKAGLADLLDIAQGPNLIKLESVFDWRVTTECLSVFNADGSMHKTCKSKLLQHFALDPVSEKPHQYISIIDMGLIWRLATPSQEDREAKKRDGSEYKWSDYLDKICSMVISHHFDACLIFLVMTCITSSSPSKTMSEEQPNINTFQMFSQDLKIYFQDQLSSTNLC